MKIKFQDGPKDGQTYDVPTGMQPPKEIILKGQGHYVLVSPNPKSLTQFHPYLSWTAK